MDTVAKRFHGSRWFLVWWLLGYVILCIMAGTHYPCSQAVFTGREHGPWTRQMNTGSLYRPLVGPTFVYRHLPPTIKDTSRPLLKAYVRQINNWKPTSINIFGSRYATVGHPSSFVQTLFVRVFFLFNVLHFVLSFTVASSRKSSRKVTHSKTVSSGSLITTCLFLACKEERKEIWTTCTGNLRPWLTRDLSEVWDNWIVILAGLKAKLDK